MTSTTPIDYNAVHTKRAASLGPIKGARVLVVGCNRGKDCRYFVDRGASEVHGLDVIDAIGAEYQAPNVVYHKESAEDMSLPSDHFDLVFCFATMEHIPKIEPAFREMVRVTRPGGFVYCVAAPLWNSRFGHHKGDVFRDDPWIHLLMSPDQIVEHYRDKGIETFAGKPIAQHVDYMMNPRNMNQVPSHAYVESCRELPGMIVLENMVQREPEDLVPEPVLAALAPRGYSREELCGQTHFYIAKKRRGPMDDVTVAWARMMIQGRHLARGIKNRIFRPFRRATA